VPPPLEPDYGTAAAAAADGGGGGGGGGTDPAAADGSSPAPAAAAAADAPSGLVGSLAGVHPLVVRTRHEFAAAARRHLRALVEQLLRAEGVAGWRGWAPVVERLAVEAAGTVGPGAAAQHGQLDPRYHVKVGGAPPGGEGSTNSIGAALAQHVERVCLGS
jgi:hypothetical protein